jgi:hypothetical protein
MPVGGGGALPGKYKNKKERTRHHTTIIFIRKKHSHK